MKERLIERLNIQLRNDMESVLIATGLLQNKSIDEKKRQRVIDIVQDKVTQAAEVLEEAHKHLDTDVKCVPLERYPVDARPPLMAAITALKEKANQRHVKVEADNSSLVGLVFAEPNSLVDVLKSILEILIEDASDSSEIRIKLQQTEQLRTYRHSVVYMFENTGYGIPQERLQKYLDQNVEISSGVFSQLQQSIRLAHEWGGELDIQSDVGKGMRFILKLRGFL